MSLVVVSFRWLSLNESPYEKVGKCGARSRGRKFRPGLNESPYEKVGKFVTGNLHHWVMSGLNESPYEKVGKLAFSTPPTASFAPASMKVPTKK